MYKLGDVHGHSSPYVTDQGNVGQGGGRRLPVKRHLPGKRLLLMMVRDCMPFFIEFNYYLFSADATPGRS